MFAVGGATDATVAVEAGRQPARQARQVWWLAEPGGGDAGTGRGTPGESRGDGRPAGQHPPGTQGGFRGLVVRASVGHCAHFACFVHSVVVVSSFLCYYIPFNVTKQSRKPSIDYIDDKYEPGSEKIALKWKNSIWIFWYLRYRFVIYFNERYTKVY